MEGLCDSIGPSEIDCCSFTRSPQSAHPFEVGPSVPLVLHLQVILSTFQRRLVGYIWETDNARS